MLTPRAKEKAKLELELINSSKELDKFDYENIVKVSLAIITALFLPLIINYLLSNKIIVVFYLMIGFLIFLTILYYWRIDPLVKDFRKKHYLTRKRYEVLGIDPIKLDAELKEIP